MHGSGGPAAPRFVTLSLDIRYARLGRDEYALGRVHNSVTTHGLVVHGLNFMDDWAMWLNYRNGHMQLKLKGMQLKVGMQRNIGKRISTRDICSLSSSLVFILLSGTHFFLLIKGKILSSNNLLYLYQKGKTHFLLEKKIFSCRILIYDLTFVTWFL